MNTTTESDLDELAFRFFKLFARYEYALKAMGFARAGSKGQVEPDWDAFANDIGQVALAFGEPEATARAYLFEHPPKRQVLVEKRVDWAEVSNEDRSARDAKIVDILGSPPSAIENREFPHPAKNKKRSADSSKISSTQSI